MATPSGGADGVAVQVKVLKAMRPLEPGHLVRGQYAGYLDEPAHPGLRTVAVPWLRDGQITQHWVIWHEPE